MMSRLLPALVLLSACVIQSDRYPRPRDLEPSWLANRPRLLAIRADPPDVRPGETTRLSALFVDPDGDLAATAWIGCTDAETTSFGCTPDPAIFDPEATPEEVAAAGLFGFEPGLPPLLTVPDDYLDGLDVRQAERGRPFTATALGIPAAFFEADPADDLDFGTLRVGFKRVMVTTREPPNENPGIVGLRVDGADAGAVVDVEPGATLTLELQLSRLALERYDYLTVDGAIEERVEQPFVEWYASSGALDRTVSIHPFLTSRWRAPETPDLEGAWWVVVKDRRGGISWHVQPWRTR
jgi:hypothetical protein